MSIDRWQTYWVFSVMDREREITLTLNALESVWHTDRPILENVTQKGDYIFHDGSVICKDNNETLMIVMGIDFATVEYGARGLIASAYVSNMQWALNRS